MSTTIQSLDKWETQIITSIENRSGFERLGLSQTFTAFTESNKDLMEHLLAHGFKQATGFSYWHFVDYRGQTVRVLSLIYHPMSLCMVKHLVELKGDNDASVIYELVLKQVFLTQPEPKKCKHIYVYSDHPEGGEFDDYEQISLVLKHLVTSETRWITVCDENLARHLKTQLFLSSDPKRGHITIKLRDKLRPFDRVEAEKYTPAPIDTVLMFTDNKQHESFVREDFESTDTNLFCHSL